MLLKQLDMPTARYVCFANDGFISYRIDAERQYIEFEQSENISSGQSPHIDNAFYTKKGTDFLRSFLYYIFNFISCNVSQNTSVTVLKTTHRVVLLTAFESLLSNSPHKTKRHPMGVFLFYGGERGIRTLGTVLAFTRFPVVRLRPAQPSLQTDFNIISYLFLKIKPFFEKI